MSNEKKPTERYVAGAQKGSSMAFDLHFDLAKMRMTATTRRLANVSDADVYARHQPMMATLIVGLPKHWTYKEIERKATFKQVTYVYVLDDGTAPLKERISELEQELKETQEVAERAIFSKGWSDLEVLSVFGMTLVVGMGLGAAALAAKLK